MKAYTKLTVTDCEQDQEFWCKNKTKKEIITLLPGLWLDFRGGRGWGYLKKFSIFIVFFLGGLGGKGANNWKSDSDCLVFNPLVLNIMETCGQQEKVLSRYLEFFLIQNSFWRYAELNRFWVGWLKFSFFELKQQERDQGLYKKPMWSMSSWL